MNLLHMWAHEWKIPSQAIDALIDGLTFDPPTTDTGPHSEAAVQTDVRMEGATKGVILWRNNVGALRDQRGGQVRFGLANDSAALNRLVKSSDLIGIEPVTITQAHVGQRIGRFVAREVKRSDWKFTGTEREMAQLNYILLVLAYGGNASFAPGRGTL